jgi:O-antigen/teichoic acid export membrane protein
MSSEAVVSDRPAQWRRSTANLAVASAAGQALLFAASFAVVRLYSAQDIGAAAAFFSVLAVAGTAAALRYELALPLIDDRDDAVAMLWLCLGIVGVASLVGGAVAAVVGAPLASALHAPEGLATLRFAVAPALAVIGAAMVFVRWAQREREYGRLARTQLVQAVSQAAGQIGLGALSAGAPGLALASIAGSSAGIGALSRRPVAELRSRPRPSQARIIALARRYSALPTLSLPAMVCNGIALGVTPLLLGALYDLRVAGLYVVAQRALSVPLRIVGTAASSTFFGDAAELHRHAPDAVRPRLRATARALAGIGAVPLLAVLVAGPDLFATVFGDTYRGAGEFARPLALLGYAQLVANPLNQVFTVVDRLGLQLAITLARAVLMTGPLLAAWAAGAGPDTALIALAAGGVAAYTLGMWLSDRVAGT